MLSIGARRALEAFCESGTEGLRTRIAAGLGNPADWPSRLPEPLSGDVQPPPFNRFMDRAVFDFTEPEVSETPRDAECRGDILYVDAIGRVIGDEGLGAAHEICGGGHLPCGVSLDDAVGEDDLPPESLAVQ